MKCVIIACLVLQFIIYIFKFKKCYKWSKAIILSLYTNWVIPFVIRTAPPPPPSPMDELWSKFHLYESEDVTNWN